MPRLIVFVVLAGVLLAGLPMSTLTAQAQTPEYEITGRWLNPPATIARGNPVVAEWRVNVNDAEEPPSNAPVENMTATFTVDKAIFDDIPELCLTTGVDPVSSISADGKTLTCNFGTVNMGRAIVVQTPVVATGLTGENVTINGTIEGQTKALDPIPIRNTFAMDIHYGQNTWYYNWNDNFTAVDVDIQWTLRLGKGSDPGPKNVTYRLNVASANGGAINVGANPRSGVVGCSPFDLNIAEGHPWSASNLPADRTTSFVDKCTLTPVSPGVFDLTLEGINYDLLKVPPKDSANNTLPPNWDAVASGSLWFRIATPLAGSITVQSNAPTYTSPTGLQSTDLAGNNRTTKPFYLPGNWSAAWWRPHTGSGGNSWDDSYRVPSGTRLLQYVTTQFPNDNVPADSDYGQCLAFDTAFVELQAPELAKARVGFEDGLNSRFTDNIAVQYYVGNHDLLTPGDGVYNPSAFNCGSDPGGWTTTPPTDMSTVKAVRLVYPHSTYESEDADWFQIYVETNIKPDAPVGQDVWMFGSALRNGTWTGHDAAANAPVITPTPNARYTHTNGRRDIVRIITATPYIEKSTPKSTVTPGVPADFTLTYSATGSGLIPATVDGYRIVDTLPVGMTYEPGSATPAPTVTVDAQGRQVLTWTLDDVPTNVENKLTYKAVVNTSVAAGTQLTNTAQSTFAGQSSAPVTETVTTSTNGYTTILKTADVEYIPNKSADGVGTGSWTVRIESRDPQSQTFTDTIDILPYNGDGRGTKFDGSYTLDDVVLPNGGTVYYTEAEQSTLSDDPAHASNGAAGNPTGNTVGWTTTKPAKPTAIRVIGGELLSGGSFEFKVVISTKGAKASNVYVNRAQARTSHTELVMRTSAPLVVSDYVVEKTADPKSGSTVRLGDKITYTVTVTQQGPVAASGAFTESMADVLDDATYNGDVKTDIGTVSYADGKLSWEGVVPVGQVAHITYSVTVKDLAGARADGNTFLKNQVTSVGCTMPEKCTTIHKYGYYEYSKTSVAKPGSTVQVGEKVTYKVRIVQRGEGAVADAWIKDDLSAVLDDATWNGDLKASAGKATLDGTTLKWTGDLAVGDVVTLTYSVTTTSIGEGDDELNNIVTDGDQGVCVPAPDQNPDCKTNHILGDYVVQKTSNPRSGSAVEVGDTITYTVTVRHIGKAPVAKATFKDNLTEVLDDATWDNEVEASAGKTAYKKPTLSWSGALEVGQEVTITYSVTVTGEGDRFMKNVVTTGGKCFPAEGQDEACTTEHFNGAYIFAKTSVPKTKSTVKVGDVVTYKVYIAQVGTAPVKGARIKDDLSAVLDDARWNGNLKASAGKATLSGSTLAWAGDLAVEQVVELTYTVTVVDTGDNALKNVVSTDDSRGFCVPAPDENPDCTTRHAKAVPPPMRPEPPVLPDTGSPVSAVGIGTGIALVLLGLATLGLIRRRRTS